MRNKTGGYKYGHLKFLLCLLFIIGLIVLLYRLDKDTKTTINAEEKNEELTVWNADSDTYKTTVLDGKNNGYILSKEGKLCYYQYERDTKNEDEDNDSKENDTLIESGTFDFDDNYGWKYYKKEYKNGLVADEIVEDKSDAKEKLPFQKILQKGMSASKRLEIVFYSGTYEMYGPYRIYSYTDISNEGEDKPNIIKKNDEAMFVNVDDSDSKTDAVKAYNGEYGINIKGLNIDLDKRYSSVFKATHASNYIVEECNFSNGIIGHVLEFNAMKNVCVRNCKFENIDYDNPELRITRDYAKAHLEEDRNFFIEVIQVEGDSNEKWKGDIPMGKCSWPITRISNDNTSSKNILIEKNTFNSVITGIGHHYYNDEDYSYQTNAKILDNHFENVVYNAVSLYGYKNIDIENNYFKKVSTDKIGGYNVFLRGCVNSKDEAYDKDFINDIAKKNTYFSEDDNKDKKLIDAKDKRISISNK